MIVRILAEGQWRIDDATRAELNGLDDAVERAVAADDEAGLSVALHELLEKVRTAGQPVGDAELLDSDLILPDADATVEEVRALLDESEDGLVPN